MLEGITSNSYECCSLCVVILCDVFLLSNLHFLIVYKFFTVSINSNISFLASLNLQHILKLSVLGGVGFLFYLYI